MAERIAQLAALVDRARALRRGVAGNSTGKRKLNKELPQPGLILADIGIDLAVGALEVRVAHEGRAAVPGAGDVNHVKVVFVDDSVQVHVHEVLPGGRAPVSFHFDRKPFRNFGSRLLDNHRHRRTQQRLPVFHGKDTVVVDLPRTVRSLSDCIVPLVRHTPEGTSKDYPRNKLQGITS